MFLDGPQNKCKKNTNGNKLNNSMLKSLFGSQLNTKIINLQSGLKDDLSKSWTRLLQVTGAGGQSGPIDGSPAANNRQQARQADFNKAPPEIRRRANTLTILANGCPANNDNNNNNNKSRIERTPLARGMHEPLVASKSARGTQIMATKVKSKTGTGTETTASQVTCNVAKRLNSMRTPGTGPIESTGTHCVVAGNGSMSQKRRSWSLRRTATSITATTRLAGGKLAAPQLSRTPIDKNKDVATSNATSRQNLWQRKLNMAGVVGSSSCKKPMDRGKFLQAQKRRFKCDLSTKVNKYDAWLSQMRKTSFSSSLFIQTNILCASLLLLLLAVLVPTIEPVHGAPLPVAQMLPNHHLTSFRGPIEGIELDSPVELDLDSLRYAVASLLKSQQELPQTTLGDNDINFLYEHPSEQAVGFGRYFRAQRDDDGTSEGREIANARMQRDVSSNNEQLWIQRRRLERDRALEPPPWLRQQPMRRGYNAPTLGDLRERNRGEFGNQEANRNEEAEVFKPVIETLADNNNIDNDAQTKKELNGSNGEEEEEEEKGEEDDDDNVTQPMSIRSNRRARQLDGRALEDALKYLLEETIGGRELLDEFYEELKLRAKQANQQRSLAPKMLAAQQDGGLEQEQPTSLDDLAQQTQRITKQQQRQQSNEAAGSLLQQVARSLANTEILQSDPIQLRQLAGKQQQQSELSDSDATLILAGDEVSSADDDGEQVVVIAPEQTNENRISQKIGERPKSLTDIELANQNINEIAANADAAFAISLLEPITVNSPHIASIEPKISDSSSKFLQNILQDPSLVASESSLRFNGLSGIAQNRQQGQQPISSFHVFEDIDQAEDPQAQEYQNQVSVPRTTAVAGDLMQVPRRTHLEQTIGQWLNSPNESGQLSVADRDMLGGGAITMKRSVAAFVVPNTDSLSRAKQQSVSQIVTDSQPTQRFASSNEQMEYLAKKAINSLNNDELIKAATLLKSNVEDWLEIARGTILGLYPIEDDQLLVKLDTTKLNAKQMLKMIQNYEFERGFIAVNWPKDGQQNPSSALSAILRALALKSGFRDKQNVPLAVVSNTEDSNEDIGFANQLALLRPSAELRPEPAMILSTKQPVRFSSRLMSENEEDLGDPTDEIRAVAAGVAPLATVENDYRLASSSYRTPGSLNNDRWPISMLTSYANSVLPSLPTAPATMLVRINGVDFPAGSASFGNERHISGNEIHATNSGRLWFNAHLLHLLALLCAILGALIIVKLLARTSADGRGRIPWSGYSSAGNSFKSLWSSSGYASHSDTVVGGSSEKPLQDSATSKPRRLSSDDSQSYSTLGDKSGLDLLARRLFNMLNRRRNDNDEDHNEPALDKQSKKQELDEASIGGYDGQTCTTGDGRKFRSSRDYINRFVEVLSKARGQMSGQQQLNEDRESESDCSNLIRTKGAESPTSCSRSMQEEAGILMSQMDISAAHLILAYMEKHLEDKERLRREWLELNSTSCSIGASAKVNQLALQRLARVALSDENRSKNRNPHVVAFDKNRVKLGCTVNNSGNSSSGLNLNSNSTSAKQQVHRPQTGRAASSSENRQTGKVQQLATIGDYINASYIHDADPRQPTHIIAQGPSEQTSGQFWQMIWEQGISVVVMLTRLNENGARMCHCYWPTDSAAASHSVHPKDRGEQLSGQTNGQRAADSAGRCQNPTPAANASNGGPSGAAAALATSLATATSSSSTANGRRGSVTSVFNGAASAALGARLAGGNNHAGQPIIANGDLTNNVLCFNIALPNRDDSLDGQQTSVSPSKASADLQQAVVSDKLTRETTNKPITTTTRLEVHLVSEHVSSSDYLVRNMYLINRSTGETRTITQFHYLAWPDNGVPGNVKSLLEFRRKVHKSYRNLRSPILVHCSDGAGRSGTYTLIDIILERIRNGAKEIDPRATLEHLRDQRPGLCATQSQFEFVLVALAEEIQLILNALPQ